jgi:hypothetical protein
MSIGASHGDELMLMFNSHLIPPMTDSDDMKVSRMLLDLWTSFASSGYAFDSFHFLKLLFNCVLCLIICILSHICIPRVPQSEEVIGHWLPTTHQQPRYLQINLESPVLINDEMPFYSKLDFWRSLLNSNSDSPSVKEEL